MIWPIIMTVHVLLGGLCAYAVTQSQPVQDTPGARFDPVAAFVLIVGMIALWPLLVLLAIDRAVSR